MTNAAVRPGPYRNIAYGVAAVSLAAAAGWIAYSRWAINHDHEVAPALPGERFYLDTAAGKLCVYASGKREGAPLLLVHSINAAASAYEIRPLFLHYAESRPVYAIDLPGFGQSDRQDRVYTARMMADALHAATAEIRRRHSMAEIDVIALSLSCEYAARVALERPDDYRSLGFISPTGFDRNLSGEGAAQSTRGSRLKLGAVSFPLWSQALFDLVTSRPSIRFFLEKTWGSKRIDEALLEYDYRSAHQPGARHAVWSFLSGYLFADDISRIYRLLELPVWAVHGSRGDFVDYRYETEVEFKPNWSLDEFFTGAFPHFEDLPAVAKSYDRFQNQIIADSALTISDEGATPRAARGRSQTTGRVALL
jgi:pimeloyl-ACP methyl ester carboxylesterase